MMKKILLGFLLISFMSCKKETYCWQCVDGAGNALLNECNLTAEQAKAKIVGTTVNGQVVTEANFNTWCNKK